MSDTAQLQALLDKGSGTVCFPEGTFIISSPLRISDFTRLTLSPKTVLRLADGANCPLITNRYKGKEPTRGVLIEGGIWDGNNAHQQRPAQAPGGVYAEGETARGQLLYFASVENFTLRDLTIKDPEAYAVQLMAIERFTVENINFDFNMLRPNMDGIHINGYARSGYIRNIKGTTNDDMIALNSDEGRFYGDDCDIVDIVIDGLYGGEDAYTGVRLLSRQAKLKNISIRNIFGAYRYHAVSFTHWAKSGTDLGWFDGITIDGVYASSSKHPGKLGFIYFQAGVSHVGKVTAQNVVRIEDDGRKNENYIFDIRENVHIAQLRIRDVYQNIADNSRPLLLQHPTSRIDELLMD